MLKEDIKKEAKKFGLRKSVALHDKDIREPLSVFLEGKYGKEQR